MATLNLYHTDSVAATLLYSLHAGRPKYSIQAAKELLVSGESEYLWSMLTLSWLLQDPSHPQECERWNGFLSSDCERFLYTLLSDRPSDLPPLRTPERLPPPRLESKEPSEWTVLPIDWSPGQANQLMLALRDALARKNWERAAYLLSPLVHANTNFVCDVFTKLGIHASMIHLFQTTVYAPLLVEVLRHALASRTHADTSKPRTIPQAWKSWWNESQGRCFHIPVEALSTWHISHKPISELIGVPTWVLGTTKVWRDARQTYGVSVAEGSFVFKEETSQEAFYATYFPNDIPDEWSYTERSKSHGLVSTNAPNPWVPGFVLCGS